MTSPGGGATIAPGTLWIRLDWGRVDVPFVAAIDCGTSAIKAGVFDLFGHAVASARRDAPVETGPCGRVEQDPGLLCQAASDALREAVESSSLPRGEILAAAISTQRATIGCTGPDGRPLGPLLSWQDERGIPWLPDLLASVPAEKLLDITGLPANAVFSYGKLAWLRACEPTRFAKTSRFTTVHDLVLSSLGADGAFLDLSNASLTGLLDLRRRTWSEAVLDALGLSAVRLPTLVESGTCVGRVSKDASPRCGLMAGTPLVAGGGDQQCAGIGAGAVRPGIVEISIGTSATVLTATDHPVVDPSGALQGCVHAAPGLWEVEGFQNSAGTALGWALSVAGLGPQTAAELDSRLAATPAGSRGVVFLPFLVGGASAPHWNPDASAAFLGLTAQHGPWDLVRAAVEGVAVETSRILQAFRGLGLRTDDVRVAGGGTRLAQVDQALADAARAPVRTLRSPEAALVGAAALAAAGVGAFPCVRAASEAMAAPGEEVRPDEAGAAALDRARRAAAFAIDGLARSGAFRSLRQGGAE